MSRFSSPRKEEKEGLLKPVSSAQLDWTDEQLMQGLSEGRLSCGAVLFERYQRPLVNFLYRLCGRRDWSEDLGQITFERMIRYRHTYRADLPFRTWMYQIARSQLADYYRRHGRESTGIFGEDHRFGREAAVSSRIEQQEQEDTLHRALQALPSDYREVLVLTRYQGMKYLEAAQLLGISEGAVKVKVYRAIQQLKSNYFKFEQE